MSGSMEAYRELEHRFRDISVLDDAIGMLRWDQATMMPPGGTGARADQLALLEVIRHERLIDDATGPLLDTAEADNEGLSDWQQANLREMRRLWLHAVAVPADLVAARRKACSQCEAMWREARPRDDFVSVAPLLAEVLDLTREVGQAKAEPLGTTVYEALLDRYEPGGRCATIDPLLDDYAAFLPAFLDEVLERQRGFRTLKPPSGPFPAAAQLALARRMAQAVGLDFTSARLDESAHPFTGGLPEDIRITTRIDEADFQGCIMAVLHEAGHAMYERFRPESWRHQPVGRSRGMVLHESQSLLVEMQACRSPAFYAWFAPILREIFGGMGAEWEPETLYRFATRVERSFVRVDADEVTYPAHVILRYRLEQAMIGGDLAVSDLPGAWREGMQELLGVEPPNDRLGCLQDIHWYDGAWGYFPTYTLGAFAAAQIFTAAVAAEPAIPDGIRQGNFGPLVAWLARHIHSKGSSRSTHDLVVDATGRPLGTEAFKAHLRDRYLA